MVSRRARTVVVTLVALVGLVLTGAPPVLARQAQQGQNPGELRIATERGPADAEAPVRVRLLDAAGEPVAGASVVVQRRQGGAWADADTVVTGDDGRATASLVRSRRPGENRFRATWAGSPSTGATTSEVVTSRLDRRAAVLRLSGAHRVRDGRSVRLGVRWTTRAGVGVEGRVRLDRRDGGRWRPVRTLRTDGEGRGSVTLTPRVDTVYRAVARRLPWVDGARSRAHAVDNVPPGEPVRLPAAAPHPRVRVPAQPRATTPGPDPVVTRIPDTVWNQMTGRSWHAGCPVGRAGLRLLRITYWGYDGYRYRGELVAAAGAVDDMRGALTAMYRARLPLRSMYRVDRFGWSGRLHGADDYRSMAAGNTSAFNCRQVVGRPGVLSPHAYGRALDVNTWENPYRSQQGLYPNAWWQGHSHPRVAWRSRQHQVVRIMGAHGLAWTYGLTDTQHFDVRTGKGRVLVPPGCRRTACD